ncbi:MAG: PilN domain-containing protein, partial [Bacteroidota bacterium]
AVLADADILPELVRFIPDGTREHVALAYHRPGERVTVSVDAGEIVTLLHEDAPEEGRWAVPSTPARGLWVVGADAPAGAFPLDLRLGETVVPAAYAPALAAGLAWLRRLDEVLNLVSEEDAEHRLSEARQAYARRMLKRVASTLIVALTVAFGGQWVGAQGVEAARMALGERSEDRQEVAAARAALDVAQQRVNEADALLQSRTSRGAELARVAGAVPDGVWIDAWDVGAAGMTVHGLALREQAVARFLNRLEALPGVERVHLQFVQQTPARSLYRSSPVPDSVDVTQFELSIPSTASK